MGSIARISTPPLGHGGPSLGFAPPPSSPQRAGQEGQADVHAVVDVGVVVGEFLVGVGDAEAGQGTVELAGTVLQVELVLVAAVDVDALQPAQVVGAALDHAHGVVGQPVLPALGDQL